MYIGTNSPKMSAKFYIIEIITPGYYFFFFFFHKKSQLSIKPSRENMFA